MEQKTGMLEQAEAAGMFDLCIEIDLGIQTRVLKTAGDVLRFVRQRANDLESEAMAHKQQRAHDANVEWDWTLEP